MVAIPTLLTQLGPLLLALAVVWVAKIYVAFKYTTIPTERAWRLGLKYSSMPLSAQVQDWLRHREEHVVYDLRSPNQNLKLPGTEKYIAIGADYALVRLTQPFQQPLLTVGIADKNAGQLQIRLSLAHLIAVTIRLLISFFLIPILLTLPVLVFDLGIPEWLLFAPSAVFVLLNIRGIHRFVQQEAHQIAAFLENESASSVP